MSWVFEDIAGFNDYLVPVVWFYIVDPRVFNQVGRIIMETFLGSRTRFLPSNQQQKLLKQTNDSVTRTGFRNHFRLKPPNINSAIPFKRSGRSLNSNFVQVIEIHLLIFKVAIGPSKDIQFVIKLTKSSIISWLY